MPEFGGNPDLDAVARTDRFLDALAAAQSPVCDDPADDALAGLLGGWRDDVRWPPATGLVPETAVADVAQALSGAAAPNRRTLRGLTFVGSAAAAVLALGGVGALVGTAHPGGPLYGLRTLLLGEPASVHDERIVLTAKTELEKVQEMIAQGQWDQAQERLTTLGDTVQTVNDAGRKQDLVDSWNRLNVQVQSRDPNAVPPPSSAPITEIPAATTAPTSVTLLVPPSPTSQTTPATTTPSTAAPTTTTEPTPTTPSATSSPPPAPTSTTAASSAVPTSAPPAREQQPSAETSATSAPPATTAAPSSVSQPEDGEDGAATGPTIPSPAP